MSSNKLQLHTFVNPIYPLRIYIVKGRPKKEDLEENFVIAYKDESFDELKECAKAFVYSDIVSYKEDGYYGVLIGIVEDLEVKDIAHESVHAASYLFKDIGAYFDFDNQEPFTYLVGWIADCINQVVTNKFK